MNRDLFIVIYLHRIFTTLRDHNSSELQKECYCIMIAVVKGVNFVQSTPWWKWAVDINMVQNTTQYVSRLKHKLIKSHCCEGFGEDIHGIYRFEIQGAYSDYISNGDGSRQTISTSVSTFRKYLLTSRVFDHQDWSAGFNCWVSRPGCAGRSRTLFKKGEYIKSDAAPLKRLS